MSLCFGKGEPILDGFTDSDMAGDVDSQKSTSGYLITFCRGSSGMKIKITEMCCSLHHRS